MNTRPRVSSPGDDSVGRRMSGRQSDSKQLITESSRQHFHCTFFHCPPLRTPRTQHPRHCRLHSPLHQSRFYLNRLSIWIYRSVFDAPAFYGTTSFRQSSDAIALSSLFTTCCSIFWWKIVCERCEVIGQRQTALAAPHRIVRRVWKCTFRRFRGIFNVIPYATVIVLAT